MCWKYSVAIPIPTSMGSVRSIAAGLWKDRMRTQRGKVHEAGKGDGPEVRGVDNVATKDLGPEWVLDTWAGGYGIKQRTNQKTVC